MDGKTIEVESSDKSAFCVYSPDGKCISDSYVSKFKTLQLKAGETIAFAGEAGENFKLVFK